MKTEQVIAALAVGVILLLAAAYLPSAFLAALEAAIKAATGVVGYVAAVIGAAKAVLGVTKVIDIAAADVQASGLTAAAGAVLVLASAIA